MIVAPYFYPKIGGLENYAYQIGKGLKEKYGWEVVVVTSGHEAHKYQADQIDGMKIYRLPRWFRISNTPVNPLWFFQINKLIAKEKPDLINAHTPVPFISDVAVRVSREIPFVLTYHGDLTKAGTVLNLLSKLYYSSVGNNTLKNSDKIIATSEYYARSSVYLKPYLKQLGIVPPGVDIHRFNPGVDKSYVKKKYGSHQFVLFVGQLDKTHTHKGINYLLQAVPVILKEIKDFKLLVVGKGDNIQNYLSYTRALSIEKNVIFTGFVPDAKLPLYYAGSDVTVLPTVDNSEGFGMVLLEAGACAKPVIGTRVGGIPFVINDRKTGLVVPPRDPQALARAIIDTLRNSQSAIRMGANGYQKVKNSFTWDKQIKKTHDLFMKYV